MTIRNRRIFILFLVFLFLVFGAGAVFYAQGWRASLSPLGISQIGAMSLRTYPENVDIFLDDKKVAQGRALFGSGVFINNLFPKTYSLRVESDGYHSWEANLMVEQRLITQAREIVLVPEKGTPLDLGAEKIDKFWPLRTGVLIRTSKGELLFGEEEFPGDNVISLSDDKSRFISHDEKRNIYYLADSERGQVLNISSMLARLGERTSALAPVDMKLISGTLVLIESNSDIKTLDILREDITKLFRGDTRSVDQIAYSRQWVAWTDIDKKTGSQFVSAYQISSGATSTLTLSPDSGVEEMKFSSQNSLTILQNDGDVLLWNPSRNVVSVLANDAKQFEWNKIGNAIAVLENNALEVIYPENPYKNLRFDIPEPSRAIRVSWYTDNAHVFVHYPDKVSFFYLIDVGLESFTNVAETGVGIYDEESNEFFYLDESELLKKVFPR